MSRGSNQSVRGIYLNVIRSSEVLDPDFQRRAHHVAKTTSDEELGSALARRQDTLQEIDDDLATWGSAKVQSAWFTRPGRDLAAAAARLSKEKRVTVLEVVASLPDLDSRFYEVCAKRQSARVAIPLLSNTSVPIETRMAAAKTIASQYESMSYARKNTVSATLAANDPSVIEAFMLATPSLETAQSVLSTMSNVSKESVDHLYSLCTKALKRTKTLHSSKMAEAKAAAARGSGWYSGQYEVASSLRIVGDVLKVLSILNTNASSDKTALLAVIDDLSEVFAKKEWKHDDEFAAALTLGRTYLDSETTARTGPSSVDLMRAASTSERMLEILQNLVSDRKLDRATAMAALCNPNANLEVAEIAAKAFGWGEPIKVLEAKHHELPVPVKVVLLSSSYGLSDEQIQKFSSNTTPAGLWMELVSYYAKKHSGIPSQLLQSRYANADIIPMLPLRVFSQPDMPGWVITAFAKYLAEELTTQAAWDGFEVLAPSHLGDVSQVIRAAKISSRAASTPSREPKQS
jgi:hypothetical protein